MHLICWGFFFPLFFLTPEFSYASRKFERAEGIQILEDTDRVGGWQEALMQRGWESTASLEIFLSFLKQAQLTELQAFIIWFNNSFFLRGEPAYYSTGIAFQVFECQ